MENTEKFRAYASAYIVLVKGDQVLLLRRYNTGYQDGNYGLVAGHFEGGETAKECIIRESREEAGIVLSPDDLDVVHVMHRIYPEREYFDVFLRAEKWGGEIINMEPDKCDELKWYDLNNLPENMVPEVKLALENIRSGIAYGQFGWGDRK